MTDQQFYTILLAVIFMLLFGFAEMLHHKFKVRAELTRKLVHTVASILALSFPILIRDLWLVLLLCGSFIVVLLLSLRLSWLRSVNGIKRISYGSISFPAAIFFSYCFYEWMSAECGREQIASYYIPVMVLGISDPLAALFGKRWPAGKYKIAGETKTLLGTACFFISALITSFIILVMLNGPAATPVWLLAFSIAAASSVAEGVTIRGLDNLTIPFACAMVYLAFNYNCMN